MTAIRIYLLVLTFIAGACAGSFVNCAADRYAAKESVFRGRSHCPACGHVLGILDLFPILSYLFLRGRCRHCGAKIPVSCLFTELFGALLFSSAFLVFGISFRTVEACLLFAGLFAVALIDLKTMEIPDGLLAFLAAVFAVFLFAHDDPLARLSDGAVAAVLFGGGLLLISCALDFVWKRETLGGGDVKLFAVVGLYAGIYGSLLTLLLSCVFGLVFALSRRGGRQKEFPFGPAISLALWVAVLFGEQILSWYLNLFL